MEEAVLLNPDVLDVCDVYAAAHLPAELGERQLTFPHAHHVYAVLFGDYVGGERGVHTAYKCRDTGMSYRLKHLDAQFVCYLYAGKADQVRLKGLDLLLEVLYDVRLLRYYAELFEISFLYLEGVRPGLVAGFVGRLVKGSVKQPDVYPFPLQAGGQDAYPRRNEGVHHGVAVNQ